MKVTYYSHDLLQYLSFYLKKGLIVCLKAKRTCKCLNASTLFIHYVIFAIVSLLCWDPGFVDLIEMAACTSADYSLVDIFSMLS